MRSVCVVALPQCVPSSVSGPLDVLAVANRLAEQAGGGALFGPLSVASEDGSPVRAFSGVEVAVDGTLPAAPPDIVILPAMVSGRDVALSSSAAIARVGEYARAGTLVCTVCAGAFVFASTGLLDGRRATTHWNLAADFRGMFPKVELVPERMLVDGGDYVCAGGVTAYLDLALHLVTRFGSAELAAACARLLLIDPGRESQSVYGAFTPREGHGDESILAVQRLMAESLAEPLTLAAMAKHAGLGERTFVRRFRRATGESPLAYLRGLRVERARRLLEATEMTVEEITVRVGYEDPASFRRLFKSVTGLPPGAYRRRFSPTR